VAPSVPDAEPMTLGPPKSRQLNEPMLVSLNDLAPAGQVYRLLERTLDLAFVRGQVAQPVWSSRRREQPCLSRCNPDGDHHRTSGFAQHRNHDCLFQLAPSFASTRADSRVLGPPNPLRSC
jgi:hypothetical protein